MVNLAERANIKLDILECIGDILTNDIDRLKRLKELYVKEDAISAEDIHLEAVKLVAYVEALEDVRRSIEESISGYTEVIIDNYHEDIRELEDNQVEEDVEDYTCYPLDVEEYDINNIPF